MTISSKHLEWWHDLLADPDLSIGLDIFQLIITPLKEIEFQRKMQPLKTMSIYSLSRILRVRE